MYYKLYLENFLRALSSTAVKNPLFYVKQLPNSLNVMKLCFPTINNLFKFLRH